MPVLRRVLSEGAKEMIGDLIVGIVAVALIVYLFGTLLRPDKF